MINLETFVTGINEGRPAGSKNKPKEWPADPKKIANDPEIKNAVEPKDVDVHAIDEVDTVEWHVDEPSPKWEEELAKFEINDLSDAAYAIAADLDEKTDFFVQGEAGWAKTSIIKALAKKYGYHILTVYLDKALATDLGGIPVPVKHKKTGKTMQDYALPGWILYMLENPNKKILLFFDEMNQAQPDVLNALMPIILEHVICGIKFDNILVGAAGNEAKENESLNDFSVPLASRLDTIQWEVHTDESWKSTFKFLHETYDETLGKELIDKIQELKAVWKSPRDIERYIIAPIFAFKKGKVSKVYDRASNILRKMLSKCIWEKANKSRSEEKQLTELAEYISKYYKGEVGGEKKSRRKGADNINTDAKNAIIEALENGYITADEGWFTEEQLESEEVKAILGKDLLVTAQNVIPDQTPDGEDHSLWDPSITGITAEVFEKIKRQMGELGKKIKYPTWDEGVKAAKKEQLIIPYSTEITIFKKNKKYSKHISDIDAEHKYQHIQSND